MDNLLLQEFMWNFSVAVIASAVGLAVTIFSLTWSKHRDFSLVAFGATSFLYGLRLLADTVLSQLTTTAPPPALLFFTAFSTYVIPVPLSGFILQLVGRGWRNSILWALRGSIAFAAAGILSDLVQATPGSLMALNNVLVVLWACAVFANFFLEPAKQTRESKAVLIGFCVFGLFALNENLVELRLLPWEWRWEELGFIVFLGTLAYGAAKRFFNNETRLLSMDREMEIARQIQSSILPLTLPVTDSLHVTARYVPMASVAGDFYDVMTDDEKRICILVADVSGHGVGAALIASMLKVTFSSQHHDLSDPARVLAGMNHALSGKLESNFVTAGCMFLDTSAGSVRYAGAGHPPLILHRRPENVIYEMSDNGLILGPFPGAEYRASSMPVQSGDRIVLYTDGIIEATNSAGIFFGDERFRTFIQANASLSTDSFADSLLGHLSEWSGKSSRESLDDDLTLIVVDVL